MSQKNIYYSDKYYDDKFEYRHVVLPKDIAKLVPKSHLMSETEWRGIGVQQSKGWVHYMIHEPGTLELESCWLWKALNKQPVLWASTRIDANYEHFNKLE